MLVWSLWAASLASVGLHAQTWEEVKGWMKEDLDRWKVMTPETASFHTPPASWETWKDEGLGVSLSFPCHPQQEEEDRGGRHTVMVWCVKDGTRYDLYFDLGALHGGDEQALEIMFLGAQYGETRVLQRKFGPVTSVPRKRVAYSGFSGRERYVTAGTYEMPTRMLAVGNSLLDLDVFGTKGSATPSSDDFFNSLVFIAK